MSDIAAKSRGTPLIRLHLGCVDFCYSIIETYLSCGQTMDLQHLVFTSLGQLKGFLRWLWYLSIISVPDKESKIPEDNIKMFTLKTYINGKRCFIHNDRSDFTISMTGPGHASWRHNNFRNVPKFR